MESAFRNRFFFKSFCDWASEDLLSLVKLRCAIFGVERPKSVHKKATQLNNGSASFTTARSLSPFPTLPFDYFCFSLCPDWLVREASHDRPATKNRE